MRSFRKVKRKLLANHLNAVRFAILLLVVILVWGISSTLRLAIRDSFIYKSMQVANSFLFTPDGSIDKFNEKTNVLLLGKAGTDQNSAPELTDTIIVASIDHKDNQVSMISVPRDIWVPDLDDKINAAYMIGKEKSDQAGIILAKSSVERIVGIPIHYAFVVDFSVLEDVINVIDGVEIDVDRSFVDEKYPIPGRENDECDGDPDFKCRYETVQFLEGTQTMDGETALKYSRSRQSTDREEGTDLARARRQQKVITAIKQKVQTFEVLSSPRKLFELYKVVNNKIETDLTNPQLALLARRVLQSDSNVSSNVIPEDLLFNPEISEEYNSLYVFIPVSEDQEWTVVHQWVADQID